MKQLFFISFVLIFMSVGCKKSNTIEDQLANTIVVNGYLEVDHPIEAIRINRLKPLNGASMDASLDIEVKMVHEGEEYFLEKDEAGLYEYYDKTYRVKPESSYTLVITDGDNVVEARAITPIKKQGFEVSKEVINTSLTLDQVDVYFNELEEVDVFYLVRMIPISNDLNPIVSEGQDVDSQKEVFIYSGDNNSISLLKSYFKYYGKHLISIDRINMEYLPLFEGTAGDVVLGNVTNGNGFLIGKDNISFNLFVQ